MWHWIVIHWFTASILAAIGAIATLWGHIMSFPTKWWEAQEARAKVNKARVELNSCQREAAIEEMMRKIETIEEEQQGKYPGKPIRVTVSRSPGDDAEIFREAARRIREKRNLPKQPPRIRAPWS
jgi:hypothetical protein